MTAMTSAPARALAASLVTALLASCSPKEAAPPPPPASGSAAPRPAAGSGSGSGSAAVDDPTSNANQYVPAEFKSGAARWKDTGVYLDGKPVGFLNFGDLPIALKPVFVKDKVSANKRPHSDDPGWKWSQTRFYRFTDYLAAVGIDVHKVREIHVYGPKFGDSIVATRADLLSPAAKEFMFRFGTDVAGKALPHVPLHFGNGMSPDKISAVMIYVDKQPPTLAADGFVLDGKSVDGVPYYGEPIRGGVRIYLDDRLATIIKRAELDPKAATAGPDGELRWPLAAFLKSKGVDASHVVEGYVIRDERRKEKLAADQLAAIYFTTNAQAKGGVMLGDQKLVTNALALHTRALAPSELPIVLPEEEW
jgi:hypothetical protein